MEKAHMGLWAIGFFALSALVAPAPENESPILSVHGHDGSILRFSSEKHRERFLTGDGPILQNECDRASATHHEYCEDSGSFDDAICREATRRVLLACPVRSERSEFKEALQDGLSGQNEIETLGTLAALQIAGLPTKDPVFHMSIKLGESLEDRHVEAVGMRLKALKQQLRSVKKSLSTASEDLTDTEYASIGKEVASFLKAAKHLHLNDLLNESNGVSLGETSRRQHDDSQWGHSIAGVKVAMKRFKKLMLHRREMDLGEGETFGRRRKKTPSENSAPDQADEAAEENLATAVATRRRRFSAMRKGGPSASQLANETKTAAKKSGVSALTDKLKKAFKTLGLDKIFLVLQKVAGSFAKSMIGFIKKAANKAIQAFMGGPGVEAFFGMLKRCAHPERAVRDFKCSGCKLSHLKGGNADNANFVYKTRPCENGGGNGRNWLWTEFVDTTKHPSEWVASVPDSSVCWDKNRVRVRCPRVVPGTERAAKYYCSERLGGFLPNAKTGIHTPINLKHPMLNRGTMQYTRENCERENPKYQGSKTDLEHGEGLGLRKCEMRTVASVGLENFDEDADKKYNNAYRCVPYITRTEPLFDDSKSGCPNPKHDHHTSNAACQASFKASSKWQQAVLPYRGMFQGKMISEKGGSSQRQLQNGLQLTGDFCIQHTRVPGSGNGTYKLPFSRTRCMMDQFTQGSIRVNVLQCLDIKISDISGMIFTKVLVPFVDRIPVVGKFLATQLNSAVQGFIGWAAGNALDSLLSNIPYIGVLYKWVTYLLKQWTNFDIRNLLTMSDPSANVDKKVVVFDFAMDADLARMRRVYAKTEEEAAKGCPEKGNYNHLWGYAAECPRAIPVRAAMTYGFRYGDYGSDGAMESQWAGRYLVLSGVNRIKMAAIKQMLCIKLPVCDTNAIKDNSQLWGPHGSRDCSGHGQCQWNKIRGNHCQCNPGFSPSKDGSRCCDSSGCSEVHPVPDQQNSKDAFVKGFQHGFQAADAGAPKVYQKETLTSARTDLGEDVGGRHSDLMKTYFLNGQLKVKGTSDVSQKCKSDPNQVGCSADCEASPDEECNSLPAGSEGDTGHCDKNGNALMIIPKSCDRTSWQCSSQKKLLDCTMTREFSPSDVAATADQICGKLLFGQRKDRIRRACAAGPKKAWACKSASDCGVNPKGQQYACDKYTVRKGCVLGVVKSCQDQGADYQTLAAMSL